ncbi:MAG: hypothetical protein HY736_13235 [Verrucomicrobia bacterium]|nr:hypothetical protein [Verrucomicrobiota bacterium]
MKPRLFSLQCVHVVGSALWLKAALSSLDAADGLAAKYPGDAGIEKDPTVLFADNFESGDMTKWDEKRGRVVMAGAQPNSGRWCVQMVNCLWLEHYGYDAGDPTKRYWQESQSVWFDDVVVARTYIGPMAKE